MAIEFADIAGTDEMGLISLTWNLGGNRAARDIYAAYDLIRIYLYRYDRDPHSIEVGQL